MRGAARIGYLVAAWLFVASAFVQVFLAGLGVFAGAQNFAVHRDFGYMFGLLTLVLLVLAIVGRLPRSLIALSALILVLFALQSVLIIAWRSGSPTVAALHPVNGFLILALGIVVARRVRAFVPPPLGAAARATAEPAD